MKKIVLLIICISMILTVPMLALSCQSGDPQGSPNGSEAPTPEESLKPLPEYAENERGPILFGLVDEAMDLVDSYTINVDDTFKMVLDGIEMNIKQTGVVTVIDSDAEYAYVVDGNHEMSASSGESVVSLIKDGYIDGKMFYYRQENESGTKNEIKLVSDATREGYEDYRENQSQLDIDITSENCKSSTCVQREDGGWSARYSDFVPAAVEEFKSAVGYIFAYLSDSCTISDVVVELEASADFRSEKLSVSFVFESSDPKETLPVFTSVSVYSNFGSTASPSLPDLSGYTVLEDLRPLRFISSYLDRWKLGSKGEAKLEIKQKYSATGISQTYNETDNIRFEVKDGKYTYNIGIDVDGNSMSIMYSEGKRKQIVGGEISTVETNDLYERMFIGSLVDSGKYDWTNISKIEIVDAEKGIYKLTVKDPDVSGFQNLSPSYATATYTVTMNGANVEEIKYNIKCSVINQGMSGRLDVTSVCTFYNGADESGDI